MRAGVGEDAESGGRFESEGGEVRCGAVGG